VTQVVLNKVETWCVKVTRYKNVEISHLGTFKFEDLAHILCWWKYWFLFRNQI